ncbi:MAG: hypothetical protein Kow0068_22760 [Marinilabiliales bacterium]
MSPNFDEDKFVYLLRYLKQNRIDLSKYTKIYLYRWFEKVINKYNFDNFNNFFKYIDGNSTQFENVVKNILPPEPELFRDTDLWEYLIINIITANYNKSENYNICFPDFTTGDDFLSLLILMSEKMIDFQKIGFFASSSVFKSAESWKKKYSLNHKKFVLSESNYKTITGQKDFNKYFSVFNNQYYFDWTKIEDFKIDFIDSDSDELCPDNKYDIIIYRNKLLYFDYKYVEIVLNQLKECLKPGGYFITGINDIDCKDYFDIIDDELKIYRHRTN